MINASKPSNLSHQMLEIQMLGKSTIGAMMK
uniref:Uncharacterized protein n=1 Tax=Arundo donax TaxID=35708 RepID=A0A0A9ATR0_ARUDO